MKKTIAILLCMLMLLSTACFAQAESTDLTPLGAYEETVVITTGKPYVADLGFIDPNDTQENNSMTRLIKERLNIEVDILWESDDYSNKLALEFASGNLPDMFYLSANDYLLYRQLVDNEMLYDLGSIYDECAGDYMKFVNGTYDNRTLTAFTEPDGAMYALASGNFDHNNAPILFLRQDWLEELDMEEPKTIEELEAVLIAFRDNYNSVGLLLNATDPLGGWGYDYTANTIAMLFGANPYAWVKDEEGKVVYGSTQDGVKDALALLARWYEEGLIDKEFATRDSAANNALFCSGEAGAMFNPWWGVYSYPSIAQIEGAKVTCVNCPLDENGKYNVPGAPASAAILCVRADYEHPEAAYKILNLEFDAYRGLDAEAYAAIEPDVSNGCDWQAMFPTYGMNLERADAMVNACNATNEMMENGKYADPSLYNAYEQSVSTSALAFSKGEATTDNDWINYHGRYVASNTFNDELNIVYPAFSFTTESMADMWPSLRSLEQTTFLKIIMGEEPVDSFDAFVEQWYAQGGQMVTDEVNELVG